ncbi:unnamed protein product [Trichogramma brassicae]|uniref:TLC domain-containing protein n=1 Tax=Trichogramma brassicae TaxID=86971 RepID=A0A6H5J1B7_9HYME|nr:unnamed protein product [Trichogramma brassicae]
MELARNFSDIFWTPNIWLPPNVSWADIAPTPQNRYADYRQLAYPLPMALALLLLRYALERYCFAPLGRNLGIKTSRSKKATPNPILEKAYATKKIKQKQITSLAKQLDWTERQVERWLRLRKTQDKPSTLTKFCENSWRCLYYTYSFLFGLYILWDKKMALGYKPFISQYFDVKRKDFWQMFIHHIATIVLMCFSWIGNLTRIGTLVLLVHDCADIFLEAAKMAKYANYQKVCDFIFVIFTVLWIVTRMGIFPFWIIYSTLIEAPKIVPMFPAYYIFNSLLSLLLVLHAFWTWLILKIAYNAFNAGQMEGDIRSDSSEEISEEIVNGTVLNNNSDISLLVRRIALQSGFFIVVHFVRRKEQNVAQIEEPQASCVASAPHRRELLLLALASHCVEVRDLGQPELPLVTRFPTVDLPTCIMHCVKETIKYIAEVLPAKSLQYIIPKDNDERYQRYTEVCNQIVHAENMIKPRLTAILSGEKNPMINKMKMTK